GVRPPRVNICRNADFTAIAGQTGEALLVSPEAGSHTLLQGARRAVILAVRTPATLRLQDPSYGTEERCQAAQIKVGASPDLRLGHWEDSLQKSPRPGVSTRVRPSVAVRPPADYGFPEVPLAHVRPNDISRRAAFAVDLAQGPVYFPDTSLSESL